MPLLSGSTLRSSRSKWPVLFGLVTGLALALAASSRLEAQCSLTGGPALFDPPAGGIAGARFFVPKLNSLALYSTATGYHVVDRYNYGYTVFSLADPLSPVFQSYNDIHAVPGYVNHKDGGTNVAAVGAAPDGSSVLVGYMFAGHGTLVLAPGWTDGSFTLQGREFGPVWSTTSVGGIRVDQIGTRYIGYMIQGGAGLYVADITSTAPSAAGVYPSERVASAPVPANTVGMDLAVNAIGNRRYIVYSTGNDPNGSRIVVVDVSTPGSAGAGISSGFSVTVLDPARDFSLPPGAYVRRARAAFHPTSGALQILAEATDASGRSVGIAVKTFDPAANGGSGGISLADTRVPYVNARSPSLGPAASSTTSGPGLIRTTDDLVAFTWETNPDGLKLFTFSANAWGTDLTPGVTFSTTNPSFFNDANNAQAPVITEGWSSGSDFFLVTGGSTNTVVTKLSCLAFPAAASLAATNAAGAAITSAFVGDTVTLTRTVTPAPNAGTPSTALTGWNMDFDFHFQSEASRTGGFAFLGSPDITMALASTANSIPGVGQITNPSTYPASLSFTGPCDPSRVNPDRPTCWLSVARSDFADVTASSSIATVPMENEGLSASTVFAFEAANASTPTAAPYGSFSLATFPFSWTVPRVLIRKGSATTGPDATPAAASQAIQLGDTLYDASEGTPDGLDGPTYRWYFETSPGSGVFGPAECAAGPSCTHAFPAIGAYSYWLTVPYRGGYVSEDYPASVADPVTGGAPATRKRGTIAVSKPLASAAMFSPITPCRLFDTRNASGPDFASPILSAGETRAFNVTGRCSLPAEAASLSVNITVTGPAAAGELRLYRGTLVSAPVASSISFRAGVTRANNGMLELARDGSGTFRVFNNSATSVHFILDVNGYFQ